MGSDNMVTNCLEELSSFLILEDDTDGDFLGVELANNTVRLQDRRKYKKSQSFAANLKDYLLVHDSDVFYFYFTRITNKKVQQ